MSALAAAGEGGRVARAQAGCDARRRRRRMAATRRARSAAVGTRGAARRGQARGGRPGAARCWAGPSEARRARGLHWAGFGRRARSEAAAREGEKSFSKYNFKEFLNAIFQILF